MSDSTKTTRITVKAPGKVILHGEHSVVYGKLAIASSIGLWTTLNLGEIHQNFIKLCLKSIDLDIIIPLEDFATRINGVPMLESYKYDLKHPQNVDYNNVIEVIEKYLEESSLKLKNSGQKTALMAFLYLYITMLHAFMSYSCPVNVNRRGIDVNIDTTITIGAGMGSSASFAVCIAAGFLEFLKTKHRENQERPEILPEAYQVLKSGNFQLGTFSNEEKQLISQWAFQAERVMHGNPSGIDNSVCTFGSIIKYRKGSALDSITFRNPLQGFLIDTNVPKDTKAQVQKVVNLKKIIPEVIQHIFEAMERISQDAIQCLEVLDKSTSKESKIEQYKVLNMLFDVNQDLLRTIGVSHGTIDKICTILKKYGLHGKITGAGGGGYVLCLIPDGYNEVILGNIEKKLGEEGFSCKLLTLGCEGVH